MITPEQVSGNFELIVRAFQEASQRALEDDVMRQMGYMVMGVSSGLCGLNPEVAERADLQGYALALFLMGYQAAEQDWGAREW